MNMFIPEIGTSLKLEEDWSVISYNIDYNSVRSELIDGGFIEEVKHVDTNHTKYYTFTLPKGTRLTVKKIELKRGKSNTNGITFYVPKTKQVLKKIGSLQFKVLLPDLEDMNFELEECNQITLDYVMKFLNDVRD